VNRQLIDGRYRVVRELGRGAMSSVLLADDLELARQVAVKLLAPTADRERFDREARAVAALAHPNIAALYDYGSADDRPYMVLEYLPGGSLEDRMQDRDGPLQDDETRTVARQVAAGLAHAHARGLVHRDLKPANILFDAEGRAKLVDFGIARVLDSHTLTEAGTVLGTASTISPEQAAGEPAGPASDVYSFGVVLFRLLTGTPPFTAANAMELVRLHRDEPPPSVASRRTDAPADLAGIVDAALQKDPARRPADGAALLRLLSDDEPATILLAPSTEEPTRVLRAGRRRRPPRRALAAAVVMLVLAAAGGVTTAVLLTTRDGGAPPSAPTTSLVPPTVPTAPSVPSTTPATTEPATSTGQGTTAPAVTTSETTTAPTTTAGTTTTAATTTSQTTTAQTTAPQTTATTPTTAPTTTGETTTTTATTTATTTTATATTAP
jgi:eukaryotic-like serine/threonine-protein kinase